MRAFSKRRLTCRRFSSIPRPAKNPLLPFRFRIHPLFLLVGVWYACAGELFLFLLSALVALQHECAHAFASAKLGYRLNEIILMPYGAVIDGDLSSISFKDELFVAVCGPLCNFCTALFFLALWWLAPTMYAFTDTACYTSLSIAIINLLPAYPLDGGRILRCALGKFFLKKTGKEDEAQNKAQKICFWIALCVACLFFAVFFIFLSQGRFHFTLLAFGFFIALGCRGSADKTAVYAKMDFSAKDALARGVEIRRVAILASCPVKDALRFLTRGAYLVLEVYDENENRLFCLTQNQLSALFTLSKTPYEEIGTLYQRVNLSKIPKR